MTKAKHLKTTIESYVYRPLPIHHLSRSTTKPTNDLCTPEARTQISLGIYPIWSESSLCAFRIAKDPWFLHADSKDSYQTGWIPMLIWDFAGHTGHFVVLSCSGPFLFYINFSFTVVNKTVVAAFPDTRAKTIDLPAEERFPVFGGDIFGKLASLCDWDLLCIPFLNFKAIEIHPNLFITQFHYNMFLDTTKFRVGPQLGSETPLLYNLNILLSI